MTRGRVIKGKDDADIAGYYETDSAFKNKPFAGTLHSLNLSASNRRQRLGSRLGAREELDAPYQA